MFEEIKEGKNKQSARRAGVGVFISWFAILLVVWFLNPKLFHLLSVIYCIIIAFGIYTVAWNSRQRLEANPLLLLGVAFFFVAVFDLLHIFASEDLALMNFSGANISWQFWLVARYLQAVSLLIIPFFGTRRSSLPILFPVYLLVSLVLFLAIYLWKFFPPSVVDSGGITLFAEWSVYSHIALMGIYLFFFLVWHKKISKALFFLPLLFVLFLLISETCFLIFPMNSEYFSLSIHSSQLVAYCFLYLAMVVSAIQYPFDTLYHNLKESEEKYRSLVENMADGVILIDEGGKVVFANPQAERIFDVPQGTLVNRSIYDFCSDWRKENQNYPPPPRKEWKRKLFAATVPKRSSAWHLLSSLTRKEYAIKPFLL
ncbi:MAG: PAS domain-containing protein [Caldiserica bacterium]|jgi:hypothetical protein|nr:PAS domain-containing protein [Caldisericota bacterium]